MKQLINSTSEPGWPNISVEFDRPIELFVDNFNGYNPDNNSFKILWVKESEEISKFKSHAINNKDKFDAIITYDEEILLTCPNAYFLEFGTSWIENFDLSIEKKFQISHLTGFKEITEGHLLRKKVHYKQNRIKNKKDFYISKYGGVENSFENKLLEESKNPLFESQFHVCIENSKQKNFFTEKLIDCLVTKTIPIFWGCDNIGQFFDTRGFFIVNSLDEIVNVCNSINENTYNEKLEYINTNFEISKKYITIIDRLEKVVEKILDDSKKKHISIVIPTYEMHGRGSEFLKFSFDILLKQTFTNFELIISDHSSNNSIKDLCENYSNILDIKYLKNNINVGNSSSNINNAIKNATGRIIKILFQDDFLYCDNSLQDIVNEFKLNKGSSWLISSCEHSVDGVDFYNKINPTFDLEQLLSGVNTISSPSVVSFLNSKYIDFDENIIWMMDCDFYIRMKENFGLPIILEKTNVVNRIWEKQFNNMISKDAKIKETEYIKNKFKKYNMKNLENNGERMDINFHNMDYNSFDMYQKSHYKRYELACGLVEKDDVVGDMACGSGYGSLMISKNCKEVFGYDIDTTTIEEIKQRYSSETGITFIEKNLLNIDEENKFDKIVSFETIEHFTPDEIKLLIPVMHKALKTDGKLIFSTPYNQVENEYSRVFHRTFYITEGVIPQLLEGYFEVEKYFYQDYVNHTVVDNIGKKDFIICIAKKING